jgi:hypothetical protein
MAFLEVDPTELLTTATRIESALPIAQESSAHGVLAASASASGRGDVTNAIESFLGAWSYGIGLMNADAQHLAELLRLAGQAYTDAEAKIGAAEA